MGIVGHFDAHVVNVIFGQFGFFGLVGYKRFGQPFENGHGDVFADRHLQKQSLLLAVFGEQGDAVVNGVAGVVDGNFFAFNKNSAAVDGVRAKNGPGQFGAAGTHQARNAQHFTSVRCKTDVAQGFALIQTLNPEHFFAARHLLFGELLRQVTAHHQFDEFVHIKINRRLGRNMPPVAQHGSPVTDFKNFVQVMTDVNNGHPVGLHFFDNGKQFVDFADAERRGWLIHNNEVGFVVQGFGHFNHLLAANPQLAERHAGVNIQVQFGQQGAGLAVHFFPVEQPAALGDFVAQKNILGDGELGYLVEFLINGGNSGILRLARIGKMHRLTFENNLAVIAGVHPGQDFHQR